jgi:hypothetical protein
VVRETLSLQEAAERSGQSITRLRRWCATGKLQCGRDANGWTISASEFPHIARVAHEHATAVEEKRVTALAVPIPAAPPDLADRVAERLGLPAGKVSITPLALDGVQYVVAVWAGESLGDGGLPALRELAVDLGGDLLDGEVKRGLEP